MTQLPDNQQADLEIVAGNVYDKYNTGNPVYRRLVDGYFNSLTELLHLVDAVNVLEVGCGEGHMADFSRKQTPKSSFYAIDVAESILSEARGAYSRIEFSCANAYRLPFASRQFDLVLALESLEHMLDAESAVGEIQRVCNPYLLASAPQEPIWRILNFLRGAYVSNFGNTPGHVRHWSPRQFVELLSGRFEVLELRMPFPWTMALCRRKQGRT